MSVSHATILHRPTVSVLLPVFNRALLVGRAIASVLNQTFRDLELIVVDDASTDGTLEVLDAFRADPRVIIVRSERNLGPAGARNLGIRHSSGRFIAFQDSDDRWLPEKLELQVAALKGKVDVDACYCGALYHGPDRCYYIPIEAEARGTTDDLSRIVLHGNPISPQMLLVGRDILFRAGLFDESLEINEDWDLSIRLAQLTRFAFIAEPLALIYRTSGSVSSHQLKDARFREEVVERHRVAFAADRRALSRQHYIAASLFLRQEHYGDAMRNFYSAFQFLPRPRTLLQLIRSGVWWTIAHASN